MRKVFFVLPVIATILFTTSFQGYSKAPEFTKAPSIPPRTIRACCAFGSNVGIVGVPFFKLTEITGIEYIGKHRYLGDRAEANGIIYTRRGGFIDMAHLRDQADWTAYLYILIKHHKGESNFELEIGHEGGSKRLFLNIPNNLSDQNMMVMASHIAYDISVWHEIATWFGISEVPFLRERFSSFSIEDDYSNLLGVILGKEAIESDLPYNEAMTHLIDEKLTELERVDSVSETYDAMEKVLNKWWTRDYKLPHANVTLKRDFSTYSYTYPLLVPKMAGTIDDACVLELPELTNCDVSLDDLYCLQLKLNMKILYNNYFAGLKRKVITNKDFPGIIDEIIYESNERLSEYSRNIKSQDLD